MIRLDSRHMLVAVLASLGLLVIAFLGMIIGACVAGFLSVPRPSSKPETVIKYVPSTPGERGLAPHGVPSGLPDAALLPNRP